MFRDAASSGGDVASLIKSSNARLTVERVVQIIRQVCLGLQAAHEQELVHRDLKPSNIFVMDDDTAKIIDFGLVHATDVSSATGLGTGGTWRRSRWKANRRRGGRIFTLWGW